MYDNAYFKLDMRGDGLYLVFFPPSHRGKPLTAADLKQYFAKIRVKTFNMDLIIEGLGNQRRLADIKVSDSMIPPVQEVVIVTISADKMEASVRFFPASDGGSKLSRQDILFNLTTSGVTHGIIEDVIDEWLENRLYCTDFLIAEGIAPEESVDAVIDFNFDVDVALSPTIAPDGSVDFHHLNLLNNVAKGDELAVLTPAYLGEPGVCVTGAKVPARKPARLALKHGKNVELSADGLILTALTGGHVELDRGKVLVQNIYTIKGDVGTATGDIEYDGIVSISGDVLTGYSVNASSDIYVYGVVEGASLKSGGDIVIASGVHGLARAVITADGNVTTNFIQESEVYAGGSVNAGSILYSNVSAKDSIFVTSGKGLVKGGELRAGALISIKTVGSPRTGANSLLTVGTDPDDLVVFNNLESSLADKHAQRTKMRQALSFLMKKSEKGETLQAEQQKLLKVLPLRLEGISEDIAQLIEQYKTMKSALENNEKGKIVIEGVIYEGAKIVISDVSYYVRDENRLCQFKKKGAEVEVGPYFKD